MVTKATDNDNHRYEDVISFPFYDPKISDRIVTSEKREITVSIATGFVLNRFDESNFLKGAYSN